MWSRWAKNCLLGCRRKSADEKELDEFNDDPFTWSKDLECHADGVFSVAVAKADVILGDHSQVEAGSNATFIGVYDSHRGVATSIYVSQHLFRHLRRLATKNRAMSEAIITDAFAETENGFLEYVREERATRPLIAAAGSCCLVGVIWNKTLFVANLGNSRAVLGYSTSSGSNEIAAEQLTQEHNMSVYKIREELIDLHPEQSNLVVQKQGVWLIKSEIQVTRALGVAYLKSSEFNFAPDFRRFHFRRPINRPVLRADPTVMTRNIGPDDKFIIFASDGLWNHLTNDEAVKIVNNNPAEGAARRLLVAAMRESARKLNIPYKKMTKYNSWTRRHYGDDITIVVVFINHKMLNLGDSPDSAPQISVRGFVDVVGQTNFIIS